MLVLRTDQNSFSGTEVLIENISANAVSSEDGEFHVIINQKPDLDKIHKIVKERIIYMKHKFDYFSNFHLIDFNAETILDVLEKRVLPPKDDPMIDNIREIINVISTDLY